MFACSYELLLPQLDNMVDAVVAAPPSHSKGQRDKEAKVERDKEERERERQKAAAAAVKAQLAAQGTIRWVQVGAGFGIARRVRRHSQQAARGRV